MQFGLASEAEKHLRELTGTLSCRDTADADIEKIVLPENHPFAVQKKVSKSNILAWWTLCKLLNEALLGCASEQPLMLPNGWCRSVRKRRT